MLKLYKSLMGGSQTQTLFPPSPIMHQQHHHVAPQIANSTLELFYDIQLSILDDSLRQERMEVGAERGYEQR